MVDREMKIIYVLWISSYSKSMSMHLDLNLNVLDRQKPQKTKPNQPTKNFQKRTNHKKSPNQPTNKTQLNLKKAQTSNNNKPKKPPLPSKQTKNETKKEQSSVFFHKENIFLQLK